MSNGVKGVEIHDIFGISEPIKKLVETIGGAIGKWYEPIGVRRMAKAKAFELQTVGEAMGSSLNLPTQYSDGKIIIDTQNYEELAKRARNRLFFQELRKQENIENIVGVAAEELAKEQYVSSEPVDSDWIIRFFNSVEDIGDDEMQKLWGKVLAGEIKQTRSFSLRTLEKLRNLSHAEALVFEKIASCCFFDKDEATLPTDSRVLKKNGIGSREIYAMIDCGLLDSSSGTVNFFIHSDEVLYLHNREHIGLFTAEKNTKNKLSLNVQRLTGSGMELYNIIDVQPDNQCFFDFLSAAKAFVQCAVSAHKIKSYSDDGLIWEDKDELPVINEHVDGELS